MLLKAFSIDGLYVLRDIISVAERRVLFERASVLSQRANRLALQSPGPSTASIAHNVNSEERFKSISLPLDEEEAGRTSTCEHFASYADGHELTYFRSRIPELGVPDLLSRFAALPAVSEEVERSRARYERPDGRFRWKLTLNRYPRSVGSAPPIGFPWHRDLVANGACTMILNLGAPGFLEFGEEPPTESGGSHLLRIS